MMGLGNQLADVDAFRTNPDNHCIFGNDPTFDLTHFKLTTMTYKQLQLIKSMGEPPTFVGPLFQHYRKTFLVIIHLHLLC